MGGSDMKFEINGNKLLNKLQAQKQRCEKKCNEAELFRTEHAKHCKAAECSAASSVKTLLLHINHHVRRLDALRDAMDGNRIYKIKADTYVNDYVDSPYDTVQFPNPKQPDKASASGFARAFANCPGN